MQVQPVSGTVGIAIKYGLMQGVLAFVIFVVPTWAGINQSWATAGGAALLVVLMVLAHRELKRTRQGVMTYAQGLGSGTLLAGSGALITCVFVYFYVKYINSGYIAAAIHAQQIALAQHGVTGAQAQQAMVMVAALMTPVGIVLTSLGTGVMLGFLIALIVSIFTQSVDPELAPPCELPIQPPERLHALDAARAFALLAGIALHAAQPYIAGMRWLTMESPNDAVAGVWYAIHMFRMPLFFLLAGFFGHMMLERRGIAGFIKDRSRRIVLPLFVGLPAVMVLTVCAFALGTLAVGGDPRGLAEFAAPALRAGHHNLLESINLMHLWFLYYLIIFYAAALILGSACAAIFGRSGRPQAAADAAVRFLMRGIWGPVLLAVPIAAYFAQSSDWLPWDGLPAAFSIVPDAGSLIVYGLAFGFGWLLHRQQALIFSLASRWPMYCLLAVMLWIVCRTMAGSTPHWDHFLQHGALIAYALAYAVGLWCATLGMIGLAIRFLSSLSPVRRYLADSSYWLYLMSIPALVFFEALLHPLPWHPAIKYLLSIAGAMPLLLLSYHYLVRFTFIGATLNGRRHLRSAPRTLRPAASS